MSIRMFLLATTAFVAIIGQAQAQTRVTSSSAAPEIASEQADAEANAGVIVVTGVRGNSARTVANSPVPIDVISAKELQSTGRTGLKEILGNIIPSLTMPALGGGGTSASVRPISIRGLSGDYLLVLVNGKRRHTTSLINNLSRISGGSTPVDIDLIPTNAVGRIELLRDGAAAQYGSDAISGVINLILDSEPEGGQISFTGGQQYSKGAPLYQTQLGFGTAVGEGGFIRVALEAKYHDRARSSAEPVPYVYPLIGGQPDPREGNVDHVIAGGYARSNRDVVVNGSYNAELPIGDSTTLYSFSTYSYRNIKDGRAGIVPSPTGYNGVANPLVNADLTEIYPDGFQVYRRISEHDFQATFGVKGELAGWGWDVSTSYGRDRARLGGENTLNPTLGPASPTSFYLGTQIQTLWVNNLDFTRDYDIGLAKPLIISAGFEHRWEKFENHAGEPDSYRDGGYRTLRYPNLAPFSPGLVAFTGTSPADAISLSRNNVAGYLDVSTSLTSRWFVGAAGRFEHYDDSAGNTGSWKVSTRYEITSHLAVRGGANTGFRAPSLAQRGISATQNNSTIVGNERILTTSKFLPVNSPAALALGARPLTPEKSLSFTAGVTYENGPLHVTVDAYQIRVDDRIVKTEFIGTGAAAAEIKAILTAGGITGVNSAQFFINGVDTRTRGLDVVGEYTIHTENVGTIRLGAAYSYSRTKLLRIASNPSQLSSLPIPIVLFGRQAQSDITSATPRDKVVLSTDWSLDRAHLLLRTTRFGRYAEASTVASGDRSFSPKWVTDLELGYDMTDRINLAVGANNLFDVYPEKNGVIAYDGAGAYGYFAPFGLSGGFYYARVSLKI